MPMVFQSKVLINSEILNRRTFIFLFVFMVSLSVLSTASFYHEIWRDEAHTVLMFRFLTWRELLQGSNHPGHPSFYYLLLRGIYAVGGEWGLHLLTLVAASFTSAILTLLLDLTIPGAFLLLIGYWLGYQYGIFLRSYPLFLFFATLCSYWYRSEKRLLTMISLVICPHLHFFGTIFSSGFLFADLVGKRLLRFRAWLSVALSLSLMIWDIYPRPVVPRQDGNGLFYALYAFMPIMEGPYIWLIISPLLALAVLFSVRSRSGIVFIVFNWCCLILFLSYIHNAPHLAGIFFFTYLIALTFCIQPLMKMQKLVLYIVLALQAGFGIRSFLVEIAAPYSMGREAAKTLIEQGMAALPIAGLRIDPGKTLCRLEHDHIQPILAGLPSSNFYNLSNNSLETVYSGYIDELLFQPVSYYCEDILKKIKNDPHRPFIVVTTPHPLRYPSAGDLSIIGIYEGSISGEDYSLYLAK